MLTMDASGKRFDRPKREIALDLLKQVHLPERYADALCAGTFSFFGN